MAHNPITNPIPFAKQNPYLQNNSLNMSNS